VSLFAQNQFSNFFGFGQFPQPDQFVDYFNVGGSAPEAQRLRPPFTLTRAQLAGVRAAAISSNGVTWQEYAADLARFNGAAQGLVIEGQRTNFIRNPRMEGAVVGNPGTAPTHMLFSTTGGLSTQVASIGVEDGISYVDFRISGTTTSGPVFALSVEAANAIAAAAGQIWTGSFHWRVINGSGPSTWQINWQERDSANTAFTSDADIAVTAAESAPLATQRVINTRTLIGVGTGFVRFRVRMNFTAGTHDFTIRIGLPQLELGAFATTPVLHPIGTPGAATRGQDFVSAPLSALGISASGACTVLMRAVFANSVSAGQASQTLLTLDDGTIANAFRLRAAAGSDQIVAARFLAGAILGSAASGAYTPGAVFRTGATFDGTGAMRHFTAGGSVQGVTGGPTSGLTTMRLGIGGLGGGAMNGEILTMRLLPQPLSDTDLQAAVNAL
jgi:hypothetical protein